METQALIEKLEGSKLYQEYERAFHDATGLPLALRPVESWKLPHHNRRGENRFCSMMAEKSGACASCLRVQQSLAEKATLEPSTVTCAVGLSDSAVPVKLGERVIGFLHTGQIFTKKPTNSQFEKVLEAVQKWGLPRTSEELKAAWFEARFLPKTEHDAVLKLLAIFAEQLSEMSNQIAVQQDNAEPPMITRAKAFIDQNFAEDLTLAQVAKAVNSSSFYFCKMFKRATGINFTEYVSRVRIERSKSLLLNPNLRVSEIAYQVGFQSLTHFNRVFRKIVGESPTKYRSRVKSS